MAATAGSSIPGNYAWEGNVLAPNGKIYCIPNGISSVLVIDTITGTTSNITTTGGGYVGGVLASNGLIYCVPASATNVMIIDPNANSVSYVSAGVSFPANYAWNSGILGPDGKIYCVPCSATSILVITPTTTSCTLSTITLASLGVTHPGAYAWAQGTLVNSSMFYLPNAPTSSPSILKLTFSGLSIVPSSNYCLSTWTNKF